MTNPMVYTQRTIALSSIVKRATSSYSIRSGRHGLGVNLRLRTSVELLMVRPCLFGQGRISEIELEPVVKGKIYKLS